MQNTRFAKVLSYIFAAESGISSFNFLYLLNIRNLSNLPYHQRKNAENILYSLFWLLCVSSDVILLKFHQLDCPQCSFFYSIHTH